MTTDSDVTTCHLCHKPLKAESRDYCAAKMMRAGVIDIVLVHRECIDDHKRRMASEAWQNSDDLRRRARKLGFKTFRDWFEGKRTA